MGKNRQDRSNKRSSGESLNESGRKPSISERVFLIISAAAVLVCGFGVMYVREHTSDGIELIEIPAESEYDLSVVNSASAEDFMQVYGIGEKRANDIITLRDSIGGFTDIKQIGYIKGISDAVLGRIIEHFYGDGLQSLSDKSDDSDEHSKDKSSDTDAQ